MVYQDVYPGIDLAYYSKANTPNDTATLEYDFIVSPGADPSKIMLHFDGANAVEISPQGDLVIDSAAGAIVQKKPFTYQETNGLAREVPSAFELDGTQVRFAVGAYDPTLPLVIDPLVLGYSTYLGGANFEVARSIAADEAGNTYVTGYTTSTKFPATAGTFDSSLDGTQDAFVAKLKPDGSGLVYATYLGGSSFDDGNAITVDGDGNAYVAGSTSSRDFPVTAGAFDTTYNQSGDAFIAKLNATGSALLFSTFLGGSDLDRPAAMVVDASHNLYVTGTTYSASFPTTQGAYDTDFGGLFDNGFAVKLNPTGSNLLYSTFIGGRSSDRPTAISVHGDGSAWVVGETLSSDFPTTLGAIDRTPNGRRDAFATKISSDGAALDYSTLLGGSGFDYAKGLALLADGDLCVSGETQSLDFPTTPNAFQKSFGGGQTDAFVLRINADGSAFDYSTYLGGSANDGGYQTSEVGEGNCFVSGDTASSNFPTTSDAYDKTHNGGGDAFLAGLSPAGSALIYSTLLGGNGSDNSYAMTTDGHQSVYLTGATFSTNFPTSSDALKRRNRGVSDAFVTKFVRV